MSVDQTTSAVEHPPVPDDRSEIEHPQLTGRRPRRLPASGGVHTTLLSAAVGAAVAAAAFAVADHVGSGPAGATTPAGTVAAVAAQLQPSVVTIDVSGTQQAGTGSGIVLRSNGYILTNDHVVTLDGTQATGTARITVVMSDGSQMAATVVGEDQPDDLAVVKVDASGLKAAAFGRSGTLTVGQPVVAIGAPLGLSDTVTSGIVSALDRPVQTGTNGQAIFDAVQTDAAINPGNSGGPLVDLTGHVIGVDSASASTGSSSGSAQPGSIGIGFAIPADEAARVAGQLIDSGHASHATLDATVQTPTNVDQTTPTGGEGALIAAVTPDGAAARAGIQAGDVVTAVGSQRVSGRVALVAAVRSVAPGQKVTLRVSRDGTAMSVSVTLGTQPS